MQQKKNLINQIKEKFSEQIEVIPGDQLLIGQFVFIEDEICQVFEKQTYRHCKTISYITRSKNISSGETIQVKQQSYQIIKETAKSSYQLLGISDDNTVTLLSQNNEIREDLKLPKNQMLSTEIRDHFLNNFDVFVDVCKFLGDIEIISSFKIGN